MTAAEGRERIELRPAVDADVETLDAITIETESVGRTVAPRGTHVPYLRHLVARGHVVVALDAADGAIVGYGATVDTGRARHLADLFVRTDRQGGGIGGHLLDAVFGDAWPRTTFASDDPRALPLYVRAGMLAYWPNLYLTGDPTRIAPDPDSTYGVEPASLEAVADLEAGWAGVDRSPDLGYWATLPAVRPFVVRADGRIVGAGIGRNAFRAPMRWMHEAVAAPDADGPAVLLAALGHALAGQELGGACVPGASPLVRRLLDLGFRVRDRDTFLASDAALVDPLREIVNTGIL